MRHADLTRLDFEAHPRWRFDEGGEQVEPVGRDAPFPKATLFAITVRGQDDAPVPGYLVGDPDDPAGLFLWLTDSSALFLNGRPLPRQDALDHLEAAFGIPRHSAFPLAFRLTEDPRGAWRHFTPRAW
ncbi:hypothetical protein [Deinococcus enclensis]|uniref:Uncharacterized protein n=1 Tax=Deinococcus enclensis TaxID=1049582 RepID=A0ABT9MFV3_9DEIO|nr:hypothetical protein [Deinococcus enclensis]MDP9765430.1 hypothetical protein [Deinococcus enclensis]